MNPKDYWKQVCAPIVRGKKDKIGRSLTNTDIALAVERATGKDTSRQLVEHWFRGIREPYMSQFIALCARLEVDPLEVLKPAGAARIAQQKIPSLIYNSRHVLDGKRTKRTKR